MSGRTDWLYDLTDLWHTLQPDASEWPVLIQQYLSGRPYHQSWARHEPVLSHSLHAPLLGDIGCNTEKSRQAQ